MEETVFQKDQEKDTHTTDTQVQNYFDLIALEWLGHKVPGLPV